MLVALTGATGFVGRRLAARLAQRGHRIRALTRSAARAPAGCEPVEGSLEEGIPSSFLQDADVLIHCAAELRDESRMAPVNVEGTRRLVEAARGKVRRWVQLSSIGVYGAPPSGDIDEAFPPRPVNAYERTKLESDGLVEAAARQGAFERVIVRPSGVFGPAMSAQGLKGMIAAIDRGVFFYVGAPAAVANFIYVDNVAAALELCAFAPAAAGGTFNLSDDISMEALVAAICAGLGRPPPRLRLPKTPVAALVALCGSLPGFPLSRARLEVLTRRVRYPIHRLENIGYRHEVSVQAGVQQLAAAWKHAARGTGN